MTQHLQTHVIAHLNQPTIDGRTLVLHPDAELKHARLPIPVTTIDDTTVGLVMLLTRPDDKVIAEIAFNDPDQHQDLLPVPFVSVGRVSQNDDGEILIDTWQLDSVQLVPIENYPWLDPETGLPR